MRRWRERHPERILEHAVSGMLPKNRTRRLRENRMVCINGETHPHISQLSQNPWKMAMRHPLVRVARALCGSLRPLLTAICV